MARESSRQPNRSETGEGLWCEITARDFAHRPGLFLDRDGVLVEDAHYLGSADDMRMLEGAPAAISRCNRLGIPVVVVTNQSGIARRLYDWQGFHAVQAALSKAAQAGEHIDATFGYHADGDSPLRGTAKRNSRVHALAHNK